MISHVMSRLTLAQPSDEAEEGFTLVEVIWAMFLMGIVAMASLMLFLTGMTSVSDLQRQQSAASLAATALDHARSVAGTGVNQHGTSGLIKGRSHSAVTASWNELTALDPALTADMTLGGTGHPIEAWDVASGMTVADQWVPIRSEQTVGTQTFTVDTLVGLCYRLKTSPNLDQACTRAPTSGTSVHEAHMYRVRVLVRWDTGTGEQQTYTVSTLVDPTEDPVWNTSLLPYAYDDEITVVAGDPPSFHAIVANNDTIDVGATNPMWNYTAPAVGSYTLGTGDARQGIYFTPPSDVSGTVTFTYELRDPAGQQSPEPATVMVHILPAPVSDALTVLPGTTTDLNDLLLANDVGVENLSPERFTTIHPFFDEAVDYFGTEEVTPETEAARANDIAALAARGVTMDSDGMVWFQSPEELGTSTTFSYYLVDDGTGADVARYPNTGRPASVTITTDEPAPEAADGDYRFDASVEDTWHEIDWRALTGAEDDVQIRVTGITGGPATHARIDGAAAVGTLGDTLEFRTVSNNMGIYQITYELETPNGTISEPATLTVTVAPVAAHDASRTVTRSYWFIRWFYGTTDFTLADLGTPSSGVRFTDVRNVSCGSVALRDNGTVMRFTAPDRAPITCTFTYRLESTANPNIDSHDPGEISIAVRSS